MIKKKYIWPFNCFTAFTKVIPRKLFPLLFFFTALILQTNLYSQPTEEWVRQYNGPDNLGYYIMAMAMDSSDNIIITGYTNRTTGAQDYCTVKYSSSGVQQWVAIYEGIPTSNGTDEATAIGVDQSGNIYVTGWSQRGGIGSNDYCTIKYSPQGVQQWIARYNYQGGGESDPNAIAIDDLGNIYVTGMSTGNGGLWNMATVKYSPNGDSLWVNRFISPYGAGALSVVIDHQFNVYITGSSSEGITTIKYNSSGSQQWVATAGNTGGVKLTLDNLNNVFVVAQLPNGVSTIMYNNSGTQQWKQNYTATYARPYDLVINKNQDVYITGYIYNTFVTGNDYITIKYNSAGVQQWANIYNGPVSDADNAYSMTIDDSSNIYVTGVSIGNSGHDFCTIKYTTSGVQQWVVRRPGGGIAILIDRNQNLYVSGNNLTYGTLIKYSQLVSVTPISNKVPDKYELRQNYPNPFNPSTRITYLLPERSFVKLEVFDLIGRKIADLVNDIQNAGEYNYSFNASDLSSGPYIYKIRTIDFSEAKIMILQK